MAVPYRLALVAAVAASAMGTAQAQVLVELRHVELAEADFGDARLAGREDGLRLHSPDFALARGQVSVGADYTYTHYGYSGLATRNRDLHRLRLPLIWTGGERLRVRLGLVPNVAASSNVFKDLFNRGGSDDFAVYGYASAERMPAQGWGWRLGAAYDDAFGEPRAYPLLAMRHRSENFALELGWPRTQLAWSLRPRLRLAFDIEPAGGRWHVVSDERDGASFFYMAEAWRGTFGAEWNFAPRWWLDARIGVEFDRHHDFEDDTGARIDRDVDTTGLFALSLRYVASE